MRLSGKVALVTGSTRGVGAEIAVVFAQQGAYVVVTGRAAEHGKAVVEDILASGGKAIFVQSDLSSEQSVRNLVDRAVSAYGRIDILVNGAASTETARAAARPVGQTSTEEFEASMKVAVYGTFWCCKYVIPRMVAAGGGSVVNISSMAAVRGLPCAPGYAASRGAVNALSRQMAADYGPHGVRVNTIVIGLVVAELGQRAAGTPEPGQGTLGPQLVPRPGEAADVAHLAVYLGSDEATFITAGELTVDGGVTMRDPEPAASFEPGNRMAAGGAAAAGG
ncbi:MAG TPA: SDR family oxidoreductase [Pseudonocardia sp.]|nr:SDR family oxidoreductase [Pseudonocardia sp.]